MSVNDSDLFVIVLKTCRLLVPIGHGEHPDLKCARIKRDEKDFNTIWELFKTIWTNPFDDSDLRNIASAVEAN